MSSDLLTPRPSSWFALIFNTYLRFLFRRQFEGVYLDADYKPSPSDTTVWFLNHYTWWDALIPFLLNDRVQHQRMCGLMDYEQLIKYPVFRKMGVFSVNRANAASALRSLAYTKELLDSDFNAFYFFPQGKIEPEWVPTLLFESGIGWLYHHLPKATFVPIATTMNTRYSQKPRLFLRIGKPVHSLEQDRKALTRLMENAMQAELNRVRELAEERTPSIERLI
jgi:1-acyl-sn-glycerol-3-phosphate acyltransferase